jgi:hypothetical protein
MTLESTRRIAVLKPIGEMFVNGLSSSYDDEYPEGDDDLNFAQYMSKEEFNAAINKINDALMDHWPCMPCTCFAYGFCICTLGLSFYCATTQVKEAEERVQLQIRRINGQKNFQTKKIQWRLMRKWYLRESFIEILVHVPNPARQEQQQQQDRDHIEIEYIDVQIPNDQEMERSV